VIPLTPLAVDIDWLALLQVSAATIVAATAIVGLMSLANWCLVPEPDSDRAALPRRLAGYALIAAIGLIIAAGLYLITHEHVARLLGLT
jgi:hypothetical protein